MYILQNKRDLEIKMINEIYPHILNTTFSQSLKTEGDDYILCYKDSRILLKKSGDILEIPKVSDITPDVTLTGLRYLFSLNSGNCFLAEDFTVEDGSFVYYEVSALRYFNRREFAWIDPGSAMEYYMESKAIMETLRLKKNSAYADLNNHIGLLYAKKGDLDIALEYFIRCKTVMDSLGLNKNSDYALLMKNIGFVYKKQRKSFAVMYYIKASEIYESLGLKKEAEETSLKAKEMDY